MAKQGGKRVNKGDCVLTDCNVTGTNVGTPDKPKFALRPLWEYSLLPSLDALVAEGGQCAGAIVVHQEDNAACDATHFLTMTLTVFSVMTLTHTLSLTLTLTIPRTIGPHKEGGFHAWLTCEFERRGWKLELQAPQGPYTNVLDLQVFPAMSKKHSELLQVYSNTEADIDRIWNIAYEIWNGMTSSMVARAFLLAFRIMGKIIETKGDTDWLKNGAPHCHVRRDYVDTDRGVKKVTDVFTVDDDEPES